MVSVLNLGFSFWKSSILNEEIEMVFDLVGNSHLSISENVYFA